jgi:hypothetical protein
MPPRSAKETSAQLWGAVAMAEYRIVRARRERCPKTARRFHITAVGTGDLQHSDRTWSTIDVLHAIEHGDRFYVESPVNRENTDVCCVLCPACLEAHSLVSALGRPLELVSGLVELH